MSIGYRIYMNDGEGGPINYATPIGSTAGLTLDSPALGTPSNTTFLVRAYDTVTGYEDQNVDARVTVRIDAGGEDVTGLPSAPISLAATARAGGSVKVTWRYPPGLPGAIPAGYHVYAGTPAPNYATPAASVGHDRDSPEKTYSATLAGLTDGVTYQVGVRAFGAGGEEANANVVSVTADATGPSAITNLVATVTP